MQGANEEKLCEVLPKYVVAYPGRYVSRYVHNARLPRLVIVGNRRFDESVVPRGEKLTAIGGPDAFRMQDAMELGNGYAEECMNFVRARYRMGIG